MSSFPRGHSLTNPARPAALPRPPLLPSLCSTLGTVRDVTCSPPHILPCVFTPASTDRLTMRIDRRSSQSLYPVAHRTRHVVVPVMCQHAALPRTTDRHGRLPACYTRTALLSACPAERVDGPSSERASHARLRVCRCLLASDSRRSHDRAIGTLSLLCPACESVSTRRRSDLRLHRLGTPPGLQYHKPTRPPQLDLPLLPSSQALLSPAQKWELVCG